MHRIRVIHWKDEESGPLLAAVRAAGFTVEYLAGRFGTPLAREIKAQPPDAILIDLSRLPAQGRELGVWLRNQKLTRSIPLVYVDGDPAKVESVKAVLPDATYAELSNLGSLLRIACEGKAANPVVPPSAMERFRGKSAAQKLGILPGSTVAVIDPPRDYLTVIGNLPEGAEIQENPEEIQDVTLWFIRDSESMMAGIRRMRAIAPKSKLWILWPKGKTNRFREGSIREMGIENGLVDYKICSVNDHWSAILFARKKQ